MKLAMVSRLSELLLETLAGEDVLAFTEHEDVAQVLRQHGINALVTAPIQKDDFQENFMPGMLDGYEINGFPAWKSLSIDRLFFWQQARPLILEHVPEPEEVFISLDLMNVFPWLAGYRFQDARITAVKTHDLITREMLIYGDTLPVDRWVVSYDDEADFLELHCSGWDVKAVMGARQKVDDDLPPDFDWKAVASGFGMDTNDQVRCIVYDKQYDWQYRRFITFNGIPPNCYVHPTDKRSLELYRSMHGHLPTYPDSLALQGCSNAALFAATERVIRSFPAHVDIDIFDYSGLNCAATLINYMGREARVIK